MGAARSPGITSLPVTPSSVAVCAERQQEGLGAQGSAGCVLMELALRKASVGRTWHMNRFQHVETVTGYGQPGSMGWLKWSERGGGRDVLR